MRGLLFQALMMLCLLLDLFLLYCCPLHAANLLAKAVSWFLCTNTCSNTCYRTHAAQMSRQHRKKVTDAFKRFRPIADVQNMSKLALQ